MFCGYQILVLLVLCMILQSTHVDAASWRRSRETSSEKPSRRRYSFGRSSRSKTSSQSSGESRAPRNKWFGRFGRNRKSAHEIAQPDVSKNRMPAEYVDRDTFGRSGNVISPHRKSTSDGGRSVFGRSSMQRRNSAPGALGSRLDPQEVRRFADRPHREEQRSVHDLTEIYGGRANFDSDVSTQSTISEVRIPARDEREEELSRFDSVANKFGARSSNVLGKRPRGDFSPEMDDKKQRPSNDPEEVWDSEEGRFVTMWDAKSSF